MTLNCVVLLRWHGVVEDRKRAVSVYSSNQSKLCDENTKCVIRMLSSLLQDARSMVGLLAFESRHINIDHQNLPIIDGNSI